MSINNGASHWNYIRKSEETIKNELIDKACEWLEKYMESLGYIDEWCRTGEDKFKKAMEE